MTKVGQFYDSAVDLAKRWLEAKRLHELSEAELKRNGVLVDRAEKEYNKVKARTEALRQTAQELRSQIDRATSSPEEAAEAIRAAGIRKRKSRR